MSDWKSIKAVGVLNEDRNEFEKTLLKRFNNQLVLKPHEQEYNSLIITFDKCEDADTLLIEEVHDTPSGNRIFFRKGDSESDFSLRSLSNSREGSYHSIETLPFSSLRGEEQNIVKEKLDNLKTHEKVLLYKSKFVQSLRSCTVKAKHEAAESPPTLKGPKLEVLLAKDRIMEWLRNLKCKFISVPDDNLNGAHEHLELQFNSYMIVIEKDASKHQSPCLAVWSDDENLIKRVEDYVKKNIHERFVEVKEFARFEFINKFLLDNLKQWIAEGESSIEIKVENNFGSKQGYCLTGFGSVESINETEKKLKEIIDQVLCKSVELSHVVSDDFSTFLLGAENILKVKFEICDSETSRNTSDSSICGVVNNTCISVIQGRIEEQQVDVVVNSTSANLNVDAGQISKSLLAKAGPELQKECYTKGNLAFGQVVETGGYKLPCKYVFHSLGQTWEEASSENAKNVLSKMVMTSLTMAQDKRITSIAFPPIGCGVLKMPANISASLIFKSIEQFLKRTSETSVVDIRVAIFEIGANGIIFQKFSEELKKLIDTPNSSWKRKCLPLIKIYGSSEEDLNRAKDKILSTKIR